MPFKRIVILGSAGSGKSTLARMMGARLSHPVVHLDRLFWQPNWTEPDPVEFQGRVAEAISGSNWICEGNYPQTTFALRLPRADLVIWLDTPRTTCLRRVVARTLRGGRRPDLADGCSEKLNKDYIAFLRYVWTFDAVHRPKIQDLLQLHGAHVPVLHLKGKDQIRDFLATLPIPAQTML